MPFEKLDFSTRAHLDELMDGPCSYEELRACLEDLERVNKLLSGYVPTLEWLDTFLQRYHDEVSIVDVGCGGGGMLREVEKRCLAKGRAVSLTGIDLNPHAIKCAQEFTRQPSSISWIADNIFTFEPSRPIHAVTSALFTHHLPEEAIINFLIWSETTATHGWFINDLRRSAKAYRAFRGLAWAMRWHPFVRHDGPVSIRRAFLPEDWRRMCSAAGLQEKDVVIEERPFGRLCVSRMKQ